MKPNKHITAIGSGVVSKTNIIGLRKAFNANIRRQRGLSTSTTAPQMTATELDLVQRLLKELEPKVTGSLHASGLKLLRSKRCAKTVAGLPAVKQFRLVGFDYIDDFHVTPVYRAVGKAGSYTFRNIPWQSGGKGPEIISKRIDQAI